MKKKLVQKPPLEQGNTTVYPQRTTESEAAKAQAHTPVVPEIMPTPQLAKERYTCRPDQTPSWKTAMEGTAVIVGIVVAVIYVFQLGEMRKATVAATRSAKDTEGFFRTDERAWVVLEAVPLKIYPPFSNFPARIIYGFYPRNVGKTIARNVHLHIENVTNSTGGPAVLGPEALAPEERSVASVVLAGDAPTNSTTLWSGRIDYVDAFDVPHWKTFCYRIIDEKGNLELCNTGNDEDNNPETK